MIWLLCRQSNGRLHLIRHGRGRQDRVGASRVNKRRYAKSLVIIYARCRCRGCKGVQRQEAANTHATGDSLTPVAQKLSTTDRLRHASSFFNFSDNCRRSLEENLVTSE